MTIYIPVLLCNCVEADFQREIQILSRSLNASVLSILYVCRPEM